MRGRSPKFMTWYIVTTNNLTDVEDPAEAADNCFVAAGIYALFVVGTSICIMRSNKVARDQHRENSASGSEMSGFASSVATSTSLSSRGGGYGRYGAPVRCCT